jgi:hypothetical protein
MIASTAANARSLDIRSFALTEQQAWTTRSS